MQRQGLVVQPYRLLVLLPSVSWYVVRTWEVGRAKVEEAPWLDGTLTDATGSTWKDLDCLCDQAVNDDCPNQRCGSSVKTEGGMGEGFAASPNASAKSTKQAPIYISYRC